MAEYIRREDAIKCIEGQCVDGKMWGNDESEGTLIEAYSAIDDLMEIPPADVAPVRHGRWEWFEDWNPSTTDHPAECNDCGWRCSECKAALEDAVGGYWDNPFVKPKLNYCPNCGCKMDLEARS